MEPGTACSTPGRSDRLSARESHPPRGYSRGHFRTRQSLSPLVSCLGTWASLRAGARRESRDRWSGTIRAGQQELPDVNDETCVHQLSATGVCRAMAAFVHIWASSNFVGASDRSGYPGRAPPLRGPGSGTASASGGSGGARHGQAAVAPYARGPGESRKGSSGSPDLLLLEDEVEPPTAAGRGIDTEKDRLAIVRSYVEKDTAAGSRRVALRRLR